MTLWDILTHKTPSILIPRGFPSADQANKYQARRSNIPGQHKNYSNVIQNHALQYRQCLVSDNLDNKSITILIDTGSSISPLDEQLYLSLSLVPPLEPISFSVSGVDDKPLLALGKTFISIAIDDTFQVQLVVTRSVLFPVVLGTDFLHMVVLWVFQLTNYTSPTPLVNRLTHHTHHTHRQCTHPTYTTHIHAHPTQSSLSYN